MKSIGFALFALGAIKAADISDSMKAQMMPFVYHPRYNMDTSGIKMQHPFDIRKWEKVVSVLEENQVLSESATYNMPEIASDHLLASYMDAGNLHEINTYSTHIAKILEIPELASFPHGTLKERVLQPL